MIAAATRAPDMLLALALLILAAFLCLLASRRPERSLRAAGMGGSIILAVVAGLLALHGSGNWQLPGNRPRLWRAP